MKSYKYKILYIANSVIDDCLKIVDELFRKKFYKDKLKKYTDNKNITNFHLLGNLKLILSYSHTHTRTLFYIINNNIKFNFIYNKKENWSGLCLPGEAISINIAQCGYCVNDIRSCIIHELVHYFDQELIFDSSSYCNIESDYDYCINRFELPAFLMEAWYRWKRKKKDKPIFRETFKQSINNILHSYFEDNDADKAYEYYLKQIQENTILNARFGKLIQN